MDTAAVAPHLHMGAEYLLFLGKILTVVFAIVFVIGLLMLVMVKLSQKSRIVSRRLNDYYQELASGLRDELLPEEELKALEKQRRQQNKERTKTGLPPGNRLFVLNFKGDMKASEVGALSQEISALLLAASPGDEVLIKIESPGGIVYSYGLAASQIERLRAAGLRVTAAVDRVAASGGYMMACVAHKIIAAPFSLVGSIGVVSQLPNFHRWLEKHNIDFEQLTSGQYKRTLTMFGENTEEGRKKVQEILDVTHEFFKNHVKHFRPQVDLAVVATGEYWFARQALDLHLVDVIQTSDDYILAAIKEREVIGVKFLAMRNPLERFMPQTRAQMNGLLPTPHVHAKIDI